MSKSLVLWKLVDLAINAAQIGLERSAIVDGIKKAEAEGKTPDEIFEMIKKMRKEAIDKLVAKLPL